MRDPRHEVGKLNVTLSQSVDCHPFFWKLVQFSIERNDLNYLSVSFFGWTVTITHNACGHCRWFSLKKIANISKPHAITDEKDIIYFKSEVHFERNLQCAQV